MFDLPFFIAVLQNLIVATLSFALVIIFEEINFSKIKLEMVEILYAGVFYGKRFINDEKTEGFFALYSGFLIAQIRIFPCLAIQFWCLENGKKMFN